MVGQYLHILSHTCMVEVGCQQISQTLLCTHICDGGTYISHDGYERRIRDGGYVSSEGVYSDGVGLCNVQLARGVDQRGVLVSGERQLRECDIDRTVMEERWRHR